MKSSTRLTSAPAGDRLAARGRRNSHLLQGADGFFSTGRKLVQCLRINFSDGLDTHGRYIYFRQLNRGTFIQTAMNHCVSNSESDAKTHRTPKALRAKLQRRLFGFAEAFGVRTRPRVALVIKYGKYLGDHVSK